MTTSVDATATQLKPLGDRLVVKPTPREEMTKSGIVLPDTAKERPQEGTVLAVGPGRTLDDGSREPMELTVGQKVLFQKYAGTEFKLDEDELLILSQKDILAVIEYPIPASRRKNPPPCQSSSSSTRRRGAP
jgi:chaperonin GroES